VQIMLWGYALDSTGTTGSGFQARSQGVLRNLLCKVESTK
jgi:hypothetical protein